MLDGAISEIQSVVEGDTAFEVAWADGQTSRFHYVWLRDNCYCELCGDCYSSLRKYMPDLASLGSKPRSFSWSGDVLRVEWAPDGHLSEYDADWLAQNRYDSAARAARRPVLTLWDGSTAHEDLSFDFAKVSADPMAQLAMQRQLITHGLVVLRGGPAKKDGVIDFAELFGEVTQSAYGAVFDLTPGNAIGTAGTTLRAVPPHSDEAFVYTPPGIEALACIRPAEEGGDSVMVDGFAIATKLQQEHPDSFDLLAQWNHHYVRLHPGKLDQRCQAPVIALDDDGSLSGIRLHTRASGPLDLPEEVMEDYLTAYHRLCALMMTPENQISLRLEAGDAVIFDNHRALHSRSAFSDRERYLQICGVTREKFHESFRLLATRLGDTHNANLVLRAGACR